MKNVYTEENEVVKMMKERIEKIIREDIAHERALVSVLIQKYEDRLDKLKALRNEIDGMMYNETKQN